MDQRLPFIRREPISIGQGRFEPSGLELFIAIAAILACLTGCASFQPKGESPTDKAQFERDNEVCHNIARHNDKSPFYPVTFMFAGAAVGAIDGLAKGIHYASAGDGAWIGAAAGASAGFIMGFGLSISEYAKAYEQCMERSGYKPEDRP
jgi:hypothetical protein